MTLEDLGYSEFFENKRKEQDLDSFDFARVISEHKERYIVRSEAGDHHAEVIGNLRFSATDRSDFPAVGDWVAISVFDGTGMEETAMIHAVISRKNVLERRASGNVEKKQIIAANIDHAIILQAVDRDFNINRLERYLSICNNADINPIIALSKVDLAKSADLEDMLTEISNRIKDLKIITLSNMQTNGIDSLKSIMNPTETYCLLGSSGVGKSTLVNNLSGDDVMKTSSISSSSDRGKHVTSHRELFVLNNGSIIIDNPGMREVGIADTGTGLEKTFDSIDQLSEQCKFKDCTHIHESGCAVLNALETGEVDSDSYNNYLKMRKEMIHYESSALEKKRKDKEFGKMVKEFKNIKKKKNM